LNCHDYRYKHPYETELNCWEPRKTDLNGKQPSDADLKKLLVSPDKAELRMVDEPEHVEAMMAELKKHAIVGFDLEHHGYRSFQGFTCLLQLSVKDKDFIVDTIKLRDHLQVVLDLS
jgi:exosome complex exonuclease RRP6